MDVLFPGTVKMGRVNWGARTDYEFVANYKVLQASFLLQDVDKHVDVDKLIRAKYQDNLEFMQWLKAFFEDNVGNGEDGYDATARRAMGKGVAMFKPAQGGPAAAPKPSSRSTAASRRQAPGAAKPKPKPAPKSRPGKAAGAAGPGSSKENAKEINVGKADSAASKAETKALEEKVAAMSVEATEGKHALENCERERDFYFNKLREVELLLQNYRGADQTVVRDILKVLYATDDDADGEVALAAAEAAIAEAQLDEDGPEDAAEDAAEADAENQENDEVLAAREDERKEEAKAPELQEQVY